MSDYIKKVFKEVLDEQARNQALANHKNAQFAPSVLDTRVRDLESRIAKLEKQLDVAKNGLEYCGDHRSYDPIFMADRSMRIVRANEALMKLQEMERGE